MSDILRVPITTTHYRNNATRQYVSGGSSTMFLEMPYNYILGSYEYAKSTLAPVINGFWGIHSDIHNPPFKTNPLTSYYGDMRNAGMEHAGILGYYGGAFQGLNHLGSFNTATNLRKLSHSMGTIGRRARLLPLIRDNAETNIVYAVMSGPNRNEFATIAKIDTTLKETVWRQIIDEDEPISYTESNVAASASAVYINYTPYQIQGQDVNIATAALGITAQEIEYLYQDADRLYFLFGGPRHRAGGYYPTGVYVYSVNKVDGEVSEHTFFNIYTLGITNKTSGANTRISYKFLGFIDQTRFLVDIQQSDADYYTTLSYEGYTYNIYRALVLYDTNDDSSRAIWVSDPLTVPMVSHQNPDYGYGAVVPTILTSTLIVSELGNSVFVPLNWDVTYYNVHAQAIVQLHLNTACDTVLSADVLDGYNSWGMRNVMYADAPSYANRYYSTNFYETGMAYCYPGNCWGMRNDYRYGRKIVDTSDIRREGMSFATIEHYDRIDYPYTLFRQSYDYLTTTREQPVLRLHAAMLYNKPKKTILPTGEDIIGQGSRISNKNGDTVVATWMRSRDPVTIANPWGVIVSYEGFTRSGSWAAETNDNYYGASVHCFNLTPNNQGAWDSYDTYCNNNWMVCTNDPQRTNYIYWIGNLPDCSFTLRRSAPDLKNCCIYWNNAQLPIKAVSYSLNPDTSYPNYAPTAWIVEAEDVATGNWIVIDEQENQSLAFPPTRSNYAYNRGMTTYSGNNDVDTRQYRNYYMLSDFKTKCPQGAHAIRIVFKDSADRTAPDGTRHVVISEFMVQEEPWEWQPVLPTESIAAISTTMNFGGSASCIAYPVTNGGGALPSFGSGTSMYHIANRQNTASMDGSSYPLGFQLAGPRTATAMPAPRGTRINRSNSYIPGSQFFWGSGVVITSGSNWGGTNLPYYGYVFNIPLTVQGFQVTISGTRTTGDADSGAVPRRIVIQGSVDNENWVDLASTPDDTTDYIYPLMPGLRNDYVDALHVNYDNAHPYCMWCKTYIFTLENPVTYKYYRLTWPEGTGTASGHSYRYYWFINSFTFLQKRDESYAKEVIAMQSVVDNEYIHHWGNNYNTGNGEAYRVDAYLKSYMVNNPEMPLYFPDQGPNWRTGYWNPWMTFGDVSNGREWGGFDCFKNMHVGYSAHGYVPYCGTQNYLGSKTNYYDPRYLRGFIICQEGTLDGTNSVSCIASWQSMLQRTTNYQHKPNTPYSLSACMLPAPDESIFQKALYSDRIKVMAYVFVRSNFMGTDACRPTHWKFYGSVDGQQWDLLDEQIKTDWTSSDVRNEFPIANPDWYVYYKVEFLDSTDGGVWLMSIDTLISGIKETDPYVHTRYPRNPVDATFPVLIQSGEQVKGNLGTVVQSRGFNAPAHLTYGSDGTSTFTINQGEPWPTYGIYLKLNPTMDPSEYPSHIKVEGSNDNSTWTLMFEDNNMAWVLDPENMRQPLSKYIDFTAPGKYQYVKVTTYKPALAAPLKEHWLQRTYCYGWAFSADKHQDLFKIFPDQYMAHADTYLAAPLANLWISDDSVAQVEEKAIKIRKLDPITQQLRIAREIRPGNGTGNILGTVMDSGKNIWYWYSTGDAYEASNDAREVVDTLHGYAVLAAQSSYTPKTVHVKFEDSTVAYTGSIMTLKVFTWIEDPMADSDDKRVAGRVRLSLSGGNAQFTTNNESTIDIDVDAGQYTEVEFKADGPDRVHVQAYMLS